MVIKVGFLIIYFPVLQLPACGGPLAEYRVEYGTACAVHSGIEGSGSNCQEPETLQVLRR